MVHKIAKATKFKRYTREASWCSLLGGGGISVHSKPPYSSTT